jgi:hypothetical protein
LRLAAPTRARPVIACTPVNTAAKIMIRTIHRGSKAISGMAYSALCGSKLAVS